MNSFDLDLTPPVIILKGKKEELHIWIDSFDDDIICGRYLYHNSDGGGFFKIEAENGIRRLRFRFYNDSTADYLWSKHIDLLDQEWNHEINVINVIDLFLADTILLKEET